MSETQATYAAPPATTDRLTAAELRWIACRWGAIPDIARLLKHVAVLHYEAERLKAETDPRPTN